MEVTLVFRKGRTQAAIRLWTDEEVQEVLNLALIMRFDYHHHQHSATALYTTSVDLCVVPSSPRDLQHHRLDFHNLFRMYRDKNGLQEPFSSW